MAIVPITADNLERFKIQTSPKRTLVSSSNGLTGSIAVFGRTSDREKDAFPPADFNSSQFDSSTIEQSRIDAINKYQQSVFEGTTGSIAGSLETYLNSVNKAPKSAVKSKRVEVTRFEPSHKFTKDTMRKNVVKNVLFPRYRPLYKSCDWSYPNYHTLNFFTGSASTNASCLIYPCSTGSAQTSDKDNFPYTPGNEFTFEFWLNPRYTTTTPTHGPGGASADGHYHAGTIMHLSSSYCISLVSGSSTDQDGYPDKFRVMFQLGHAAQTRPHKVGLYNADGTASSTNPRTGATLRSNTQLFTARASVVEGFDNDYTKGKGTIALTSDNILKKDHWHHVAIRGGKGINNNKGSFYVDGKIAGTFPVCANSYAGDVMPLQMDIPDGDPDALIVGNYLDTTFVGAPEPILARFFNVNTAYKEGLVSMYRGQYDKSLAAEPSHSDPQSSRFKFTNPLNAEIHEVRIWKEYKSVDNLITGSRGSLTQMSGSLIFYVPPWFTKETRKREVLQTPFQSFRTKTDDPFNVALSFGVGGRELNLPNFTRELVQGVSPRLYNLVASENAGSTQFMSANDLLYDAEYTSNTGEQIGSRNGEDRGFSNIRKGNLSILPNDNGLFNPDWSLLDTTKTTLGTFGIIPASGSITYTGQPAVNDRVKITSTSGASHTFSFTSSGVNGAKDLDGIVNVLIAGSEDATYTNFVAATTQATTFGSDLSAVLADGQNLITLRQGRNGSAGNTSIVTSFPKLNQSSLTNATAVSFTGGEDDPSVAGTATDKFVDAFGVKNLGLISLEKMVSTGSIPEGLVDIVSEYRGKPGIGSFAAAAEITWTKDITIQDKATITIVSHNSKEVTYKFLNDSLGGRANGTVDSDNTVIIDARPAVDSADGGTATNINDVWYRFMTAVNTGHGGYINVTAPSVVAPSVYDTFDPEMTSIILKQSIKGERGNTSIKKAGTWDSAITIPSKFSGGKDNPDASILNSLEGASPEDPGIAPGGILTILNRTRDPSSNEVVFFDTSNLFYGNRIKPGSYIITDSAITGSGGRVGITLRDNKEGGLYRADCKTKAATWNEIGTLIYEEGIAVIKTPNVPFFGRDQFEVTMQGEYNVHVLEINVPAPKGKINSSSNPNYKNLKPSDYASETANKFVYITSINLHDENFNIVGRANLAQPIAKRDTDGYMFRLKMDY